MNITTKPTEKLEGTIKAPPSKSYTHRAIIIASLAGGRSVIKNPLISADTMASVDACRAIGADIQVGEEIIVEGVGGNPGLPGKAIDVRNSGTTIRIMAAVAGLCHGKVTLTGDDSIQKRPMEPLLKALEGLGAKTSSTGGKPPVSVEGPLQGFSCKIRGDISSQFISGLLITLPLMPGDTIISVTDGLKSRPYIDLTLDVMRGFGVEVGFEDNIFHIPGNQGYKARNYTVEGDYSSAAFILAAASLTNSDVTVKNLFRESKQGDRRIVNILGDMGVELRVYRDSVRVFGGRRLRGVELDGSDTPDLVPVLAVLGSLAEGKTSIGNAGHLRYKESDRLKAMSSELRKMGANIREREDGLEIGGVDMLRGSRLHGWDDHRIVMALSVAGLKARGETTVDCAETVDISFPGFVDVTRKLGADIKIQSL